MNRKFNEQKRAKSLRKKGLTLSEIACRLKVSKSSVSVWVRGVKLSSDAMLKVGKRSIEGRMRAIAGNIKRARDREKESIDWAKLIVSKHKLSVFEYQMICAILYWGEGAKTSNRVEFTNSDPKMVKMFLKSIQIGYGTDVSKLKVNLHLHDYHNEIRQKNFWKNAIGVRLNQFNKTFWKKSDHNRVNRGYPGCIRICFYSKVLVDRIKAFYAELAEK